MNLEKCIEVVKIIKEKIGEKKRAFKEYCKSTRYVHAYYHHKIKKNIAIVESRFGEDLAGNMFRIVQELQKRKFKIYISIKKGYDEKIHSLCSAGNINKVVFLRVCSLKYYKILATAKYLFNDTVFDAKWIKKEGQIYVNTWHGTPLKKLGYHVKGQQYIQGNGQRNFLMCDYIAMPNKYCAEKLINAYYLQNIYHGKILYSGYPRNSVFYNDEQRVKIKDELKIQDKEIFVYMPTWREKEDEKTKFLDNIISTLDYLDAYLEDSKIMYVKLHNLMYSSIDLTRYTHIKKFPEKYEPYELLNCADCLITDYSSVFFDFANTKRKIILYVPDKTEYFASRGVYFSIDELPFPQVENEKQLFIEMNKKEFTAYPDVIKKYCTYDSKESVEKLLEYVMEGKQICEEEKLMANGKKNIAIYSSNLDLKNGITTSLANLLSLQNFKNYNIFCMFFHQTQKEDGIFLNTKVPNGVSLFSICSPFSFTLKEKCVYKLQQTNHRCFRWSQKILNKMCEREIKKLFFDCPFDSIVHFEGYGTNDTIPLLQHYPKQSIIFVHNDMVQEIKVRHNQNPYILKEAYQKYDKVAVVSPDLIEPTIACGAPKEKIFVVNNTHNADEVEKRALLPITFDKDTECVTNNPGGIEGVLSSQGKKFITIGRFSPEKGHERLLRAFDEFCDFYSDTQLIIIGGHGVLYNDTLEWAKQMQHWQNVTVIKSLSNPMPILKRCDLFVLSSLYEGLGLVLLEADCLGVPSFATDITGPSMFMQKYHGHLVENSECGILQGMYDYMNGKVHTLDIDYKEYNRQALAEFESLFEEAK